MKYIIHYYDNFIVIDNPTIVSVKITNPNKKDVTVTVKFSESEYANIKFDTREDALVFVRSLLENITHNKEIIHLYSK